MTAFREPPVVEGLESYRRARPDAVMPLSEALAAWQRVAEATEPRLQGFVEPQLARVAPDPSVGPDEPVGVLCLRVFGHYYLHIGQLTAVRRWLGMPVPGFVGRLPVPGESDEWLDPRARGRTD